MTAPLSPQRAEWKRLADAATPGPWERLAGDEGRRIASEPLRVLGFDSVIARIESGRHHHDAVFVAAARDAVPALLAALDAVEARERDPVASLGLSDEQTAILRDLLASRQQTISEWLGDVLMDMGLGRATGKQYPPPAALAEPEDEQA